MQYFIKLADTIGLSILDIGARRGSITDLAELAPAISYYGFEPDKDESQRLNAHAGSEKWKHAEYFPVAVADRECELSLHLYRQRGCSSVLEAQPALGELFSRGDYYALDETVRVPAKPLDQIVREENINAPAFLKIDVQGMEVDCFKGAPNTLTNSLVGIRTEVSFFPLYANQPLFAEVDQALRDYGFVPMRWLEFHEWRRLTKIKHPALAKGQTPYSRGQMIHADVLYLLHPEGVAAQSDAQSDVQIKRLIRLGLVALAYEHFDHALAAFSQPGVRDFVQEMQQFDPIIAVQTLSRVEAGKFRNILSRLMEKLR